MWPGRSTLTARRRSRQRLRRFGFKRLSTIGSMRISVADQARIAGLACEAAYDGIRAAAVPTKK